jgi:pyridoxamine 5'-phosphate oxidase
MPEKVLIKSNKSKIHHLKNLNENNVNPDPFEQFDVWYKESQILQLTEPAAMDLATADKNGRPSCRTVLLKRYDERGFVFYTNYNSRKGKELNENNFACILFYWGEARRQIRIEGRVEKVSQITSDEYFKTRPFKSRLGAWASDQSEVIENRFVIVKKFFKYLLKFGSKNIPLPDFWGGYILIPDVFEFWQGRENRLHDRIRYTILNNKWEIDRLSP